MKENISMLLIACLIFQLTGCYSLQEISKGELVQRVYTRELNVWTKKNKLTFESTDYSVQNDSILVLGKSEMLGGKSFDKKSTVDFDGKIALADIKQVKANKFDLLGTLAVTTGISVTLYFLISKNMDTWKPLGNSKL